MKMKYHLFTMLAIGLLAPLGCSKSDQSSSPPTEVHGAKLDLAKLDSEFATAAQDVRTRVLTAKGFFRYGQFDRALVELDQLAQVPSLTAPQKKVVSDLIEQTKQVMAKTPAPPAK